MGVCRFSDTARTPLALQRISSECRKTDQNEYPDNQPEEKTLMTSGTRNSNTLWSLSSPHFEQYIEILSEIHLTFHYLRSFLISIAPPHDFPLK